MSEKHSNLLNNLKNELEIRNGDNFNTLWWQHDVAPCHVTDHNMIYLDHKFECRVASRRAIRGHDRPARSPDLNPLDFFLWGVLEIPSIHTKTKRFKRIKTGLGESSC